MTTESLNGDLQQLKARAALPVGETAIMAMASLHNVGLAQTQNALMEKLNRVDTTDSCFPQKSGLFCIAFN